VCRSALVQNPPGRGLGRLVRNLWSMDRPQGARGNDAAGSGQTPPRRTTQPSCPKNRASPRSTGRPRSDARDWRDSQPRDRPGGAPGHSRRRRRRDCEHRRHRRHHRLLQVIGRTRMRPPATRPGVSFCSASRSRGAGPDGAASGTRLARERRRWPTPGSGSSATSGAG
jgi:hypothetical protein